MQPWPFIISNPHCGTVVPQIIQAQSKLSPLQITKDGDEQALEIYAPLSALSEYYIEATAARAFVDLNRRVDDFSKDGVVKTHTCWDEPIYRQPLTDQQVQQLLTEHYHSYHHALREAAASNRFSWLLDCHTMAEYPPPVAPDKDQKRPLVCLGNGNGETCSETQFNKIFDIFSEVFDGLVSNNQPFAGGYICRHYAQYLPTLQIELSRTMDMSVAEKSDRIQAAFGRIAKL